MYVRGNLPREPLPACKLGSTGLEFFEDVRTRWVAGPLADAYFGVCGPGGAAGAPRRRRAGRPGAGARGPGRLQRN